MTISAAVLIGTLCLTLTGRALLAEWALRRQEEVGVPIPPAVQVVFFSPQLVDTGLQLSGLVQELRKVELSFRVPGTVEELAQITPPGGPTRDLHAGDSLPAGTLLARLDTADFERDRALAAERAATSQARLVQAQAELRLAKRDLERNEQLLRKKVVSDADHDAAVSRVDSATAAERALAREVDAASIQLEQAAANLRYCTLTVPFPEGTIARRQVDRQQRVAAHQPAFLLLDLSSVVIRCSVSDAFVGRLRVGQPLEVTADALPGQTLPGIVHMIASTADPLTKTYPIEVRVDEPAGLRPGMVAAVRLRERLTAHLLPLTALASGGESGEFIVYRIVGGEAESFVEAVAIEPEAVLDNRVAIRVASSRGLRPGDRVVRVATHRLHPGQAVRIAR